MNNYLVMKSITKDFSGGRALDCVSFSVEKAEIHGVSGIRIRMKYKKTNALDFLLNEKVFEEI